MLRADFQKGGVMARVYRDSRLRRSTGQVVWCIDFVDTDGRRRRERTLATTKEGAQRELRRKLDEIDKARIVGLPKISETTFDKFLPDYLAHVDAVRSESAKVRVRSHLKALTRFFSGMLLRKITSGDVQRWIDQRSQEQKLTRFRTPMKRIIKPATVVTEFVTLSAIFREAKKRGHCTENPCRGVSLPRVNNKLIRCLSDDQEKKLLAACTKGLADVVLTALLSGLRRGELFDLRRGDIDLENGILTVVHGKGEKMRHIPIVPELKEVLERQPVHVKDGKPSPYVFNNPHTCTGWVDIKKAWARALRVAAIRDFRFHDLRHTFASRLVQRGVPIKAVQELLGHADMKMTMRYAHLAPHNLRDAVAVLSKKAKRPRRVGTRLAQAGKAETRETA